MTRKVIQPVIVGIIRKNGKYLLTRRNDVDPEDKVFGDNSNRWQIPGGGLEFGESVEECLLREIKEEAGVDIEIISMISHLYEDVRNNAWHGLLIVFLCRMKNENDEIILNSEASEYKWLSYNEINEYKTLPHTQEMIDEAEKL